MVLCGLWGWTRVCPSEMGGERVAPKHVWWFTCCGSNGRTLMAHVGAHHAACSPQLAQNHAVAWVATHCASPSTRCSSPRVSSAPSTWSSRSHIRLLDRNCTPDVRCKVRGRGRSGIRAPTFCRAGGDSGQQGRAGAQSMGAGCSGAITAPRSAGRRAGEVHQRPRWRQAGSPIKVRQAAACPGSKSTKWASGVCIRTSRRWRCTR